jgi:hypothetical protein
MIYMNLKGAHREGVGVCLIVFALHVESVCSVHKLQN